VNNHVVRILCCDIYHHSNDYVCEYIASYEPDFIGIGFLAARFKETVLPLCNAIRKVKRPECVLALGGHGASGSPAYVKHVTNADEVICGEGESYFTSDNMSFPSVDDIPLPAYDLFPVDEYAKCLKLPGWEFGDRTLGVLSSRGCIGKCTFCQRLTKGMRLRSMEAFVDELQMLNRQYGINYFFIQDELFVVSKKRMFEFQAELSKRNMKIKFACDSRVNIVDEELLECLKDAGCQFLDYGFESMDDKVLKLMRKGQTSDDNYKCAMVTKKSGIPFNINILWGMPGDTPTSLQRGVEFIKEFDSGRNIRTIRPPTPYPGCELYTQAITSGKLSGPQDFYDKFTNSDRLTVNFTGMTDETFYMHLYAANSNLLHWQMERKATQMTEQFYNVYFKQDYKFRGARHYV
jgi:radical SAM superfamily enzyme YgiQ (UPF0313 family)